MINSNENKHLYYCDDCQKYFFGFNAYENNWCKSCGKKLIRIPDNYLDDTKTGFKDAQLKRQFLIYCSRQRLEKENMMMQKYKSGTASFMTVCAVIAYICTAISIIVVTAYTSKNNSVSNDNAIGAAWLSALIFFLVGSAFIGLSKIINQNILIMRMMDKN